MMNRRKGILIAATLTGLVLVAFLALGFGTVIANSTDSSGQAQTVPENVSAGTGSRDLEQELKAWQEYSRRLEQTVLTMQARENQYRQQLVSANQTIVRLQDQINRGNVLQLRSFGQEHEENEFRGFDD